MQSKTTLLITCIGVACVAILAVFMVIAGRATPYQQGQVPPAPVKPLTVEQKYDVLKAVSSSTVMGTSMRATTTVVNEKMKQEVIKNVSATSASSTESESGKLNTLRALQQ